MMGVSHRPLGAAWWLGGVLALNTAGAGINPIVAAGGVVIAPVFAAGRLSPDADITWLRHLGHRQATHRPDTTAVYLTAVTLVIWLPLVVLLPGGLHWLAWAPVAGWWSHLAGDALFGLIPVGRPLGALLARILPARLIRRSGGRQAYWVGTGWDTGGLLERGEIRTAERTPTGLHKTRRPWWMFGIAPTTSFLRGSVVVLYVATTALYLGVSP